MRLELGLLFAAGVGYLIVLFLVAYATERGIIPARLAKHPLTSALALGYIGFMLVVVRPFLGRLGAVSANREGLTQNMVAATLLVLLASSWTTELIGIHALFGAFMLGIVVPTEGNFGRLLAEKLEDVVVVP